MMAVTMPAAETVGTDNLDELEILLAAARTGNRDALEDFLRQIERRVYVFAFRMVGNAVLAEDVAQEALWKICRNLNRYRSGVEPLGVGISNRVESSARFAAARPARDDDWGL
jgi:hypothetical protein